MPEQPQQQQQQQHEHQQQQQQHELTLSRWAPKQLQQRGGAVRTLAELAALLRAEFEGRTAVCPQRLQAIMAAYSPERGGADWRDFATFDRYRYTRNLVDAGDGRYNLMLLCWGEGHGSAVHDHADAHCVMRVLDGSLSEVRFAWPERSASATETTGADEETVGEMEQPLVETGRCTLAAGDVCYINDSLGLHRVENASHADRAVSLHLYCPPFSECSVFNQRTGRRSRCPVTFWSIPGQPRVRRAEARAAAPAEDN